MRTGTLAFLFGILLVLRLPELPDPRWCLLLPAVLVLAAVARPTRPLALVMAGVLWAVLRADLGLSGELPAEIEGADVTLIGTVDGVPERDGGALRFEFSVQAIEPANPAWSLPARVRLQWQETPAALGAGERWRITARLRRPRGFSNPGSFDYEAWLLLHGLRATGYVRAAPGDGRIAGPQGAPIDRLRGLLAERIDAALADRPQRGVVKGLVVGLTGDVQDRQWEVFRKTGTTHLMAISGSHIVLVAGAVFLAARWLWSLAGYPVLWAAAPRVAAVASLLAASVYAGLAGFSVPTQRAVVMVGVALFARVWRGTLGGSQALALGALGVLLIDPLAPLSPGFWLSFTAVGVLLLVSSGDPPGRGAWARWGRVHVLVALGLLPVTLAAFGQNPWLGPVANAVAVPWLGVLVVPPALLGAMLSVPWPALGEGLLRLSALAVDGLWPILDWLAQRDWVYRGGVESSPVAVLAAGIGAFILLLPRGVPGRWVGALGLLPLLLPSPVRPPPGEVWLTVLDVGQGLAAVVETAGHVLVYDAGPRYSPGLDAGEAVVAPFLQWRGVARIDTLVLSHGDGDHIGGASSLVRAVPVGGILGAGIDSGPSAHPCRRGEEWAWDGVSFRVLHPSGARPSGDNASSCVLRVETSNGVLLIPGDVEARTEAELVAREGTSLRADVLVVPHHGSRGASSRMFVEAVAPRDALFATGYGNRFRFPAGEVLARYAALGARLHDTARGGAITVRLGGPRVAEVSHYRVDHRRFWHTPLADTPGGPHRANSGARTSAASSAPVGAGG